MQAQPTQTTVSTLPAATVAAASKRYRNGVLALDNLSLDLQQGEIMALLGPNGAGKSTVVKLLMGLAEPTSGQVRIFGQDPRHAPNRLRTGAMLQVGKAPETLRVREHIELFRGYYPAPLAASELSRIAGLGDIEDRLFGELSGGQKQRVLFALALAGDPDLIFLDEPTLGLDIEARRSMWQAIRGLAAQGKTVLLTTHYLEEADALASRIAVINKGCLICAGTPAEVKAYAAAHKANLPTDLLPGVSVPVEFTRRPQGGMTSSPVKLIRCDTTLNRTHLQGMPGVVTVEQPPRELGSEARLHTTVSTSQPEATLRELLALDLLLTGLRVTDPALEDAFLALTTTSVS